MKIYVLDKNTALLLNKKAFVLAREKKVTKNSVCDQCALADICIDGEDNHHLSSLCMSDEEDQRWFFIDCRWLGEWDTESLIWNFNQCLTNK